MFYFPYLLLNLSPNNLALILQLWCSLSMNPFQICQFFLKLNFSIKFIAHTETKLLKVKKWYLPLGALHSKVSICNIKLNRHSLLTKNEAAAGNGQ